MGNTFDFWQVTSLTCGIKFRKIKSKNIDFYKKVSNKVRETYKESKLCTKYNIDQEELIVEGDSLDIYYFGFFTKELE